ncbi:MAG: gliding motility lipoprotein GldH [Prolixibacteraceae bacterium]|jgi:gliding motility-associated lipoprotein GldH|nr:gliding motility lipoprotein GldH [Prolixibacteraceae bacterium]
MRQGFLFFLIIASVAACDRNRVFESYREVHRDGWGKDSLVVFNFEIQDTVQVHNLYINLRNKGNYPYSNIWLFLSIDSPDGTILPDTVEFTLADNSGRWTGSGLGDLFDNQFIYRSNVYFPQCGAYQFNIQQGMRDEMLEGIRDVGIRVEKRK